MIKIESYGMYNSPGVGAHTFKIIWPGLPGTPSVYYSYETPVAFRYHHDGYWDLVVWDCQESPTTKRHIRFITIDPDVIVNESDWTWQFNEMLEETGIELPVIDLHLGAYR